MHTAFSAMTTTTHKLGTAVSAGSTPLTYPKLLAIITLTGAGSQALPGVSLGLYAVRLWAERSLRPPALQVPSSLAAESLLVSH